MTRLLVLAVFGCSVAAHGYVLRHDAAGSPVQWSTSPTFVISPELAASLNLPDAESAVRAAVATYAADLPELGLTVQVGTPMALGYDTTPGAVNQNDIVAISHDWPYDEDAIAVTLLATDPQTHDILDADIVLNTASHTFAVLPNDSQPGGSDDDLQNTLTHELGHALGLAHNGTDPSVVMYPSALKGEVIKRVLSADDKAGLAFLYPDATGGSNPASFGCSAAGGEGPVSALALAGCALLARCARRRRLGDPLSGR